jgi:hypothetical protein
VSQLSRPGTSSSTFGYSRPGTGYSNDLGYNLSRPGTTNSMAYREQPSRSGTVGSAGGGPSVQDAAMHVQVRPLSKWSRRSTAGGTPPLGYPAGRVVTPASPGRPPSRGGAGHSGPFPFRESVEGNPARCTDGGAGCSLAVHAPQNALMCDGTNRGALLCTARVSQPHVGACGIGRENPIMTVPRC